MKRHVIVGRSGWVMGTRIHDGPMMRPHPSFIPVDAAMHEIAQTVPMVRHADGVFELPQDDRVAWHCWRLAGETGENAFSKLSLVRAARRLITRDLSVTPQPIPLIQPTGIPLGPIADAPGLEIAPMTHAHLDKAAQVAIDSGIYPATCPRTAPGEHGEPVDVCFCQPPEAHAWLQLAQRFDNQNTWQLALNFHGQPLQFELIFMHEDTATISLTYHSNRERPHWFWREAEGPVFAALKTAGVKRIQSRTRSDRPDWIQALKDNYNAYEIGQDKLTTHLEFPLDLSLFKGWPARKLLGFDRTQGSVRTWEATEVDLPAIRTLARSMPADRRPIVLRMIDEWWTLDRATILLGSVDGALRYVRAIRDREKGTLGSLSHLSPMFDEPQQAVMTAHMRLWARQAGYTQLNSWLPTRLVSSPNVQAQLGRANARVTGTRKYAEEFTEITTDV